MASDRPDGPVPGFGLPRHGRPAAPLPPPRRPTPWLAGSLVVVVVLAVAGVLVLYAAHRSAAPRPGGGAAAGGAHRAERGGNPAGSAPSPASSGATISITDVGDLNFGMDGRYAPGGPAALLAGVASDLRSNLTVGNLETALGDSGVTKCPAHPAGCFAFQAPADSAAAVRRDGFSVVNVANNHTDDAGAAGIQETDAALTAAHLRWTGRPGQTTYVVRRGVRIALLGFAPYAYDRNLLDIPAAMRAVRRAAARARLVIVFIHAGAEGAGAQHTRPGMETYLGEERGDPIAFSDAVVDAGADLVLGSGPHVLRAMQWYHRRLIAYSLGNFAGYYTLGLGGVTADSAILHVRLRADGTFAGGYVTPIRLVGGGSPEPDPSRAAIQIINSLSRGDLGASGVRLTAAGRIRRPHRRRPADPLTRRDSRPAAPWSPARTARP
jgi:poly-gamma-glutamate capsule biosynthesis protein CapA/YwtB (metallophosphatase superfamily)